MTVSGWTNISAARQCVQDRGSGDPEQPSSAAKTRSCDRRFEGSDLLPERDTLKNQLVMPTAGDSQRASEQQIDVQDAVDAAVPRHVGSAGNRQR
jgi:hypothetical protein